MGLDTSSFFIVINMNRVLKSKLKLRRITARCCRATPGACRPRRQQGPRAPCAALRRVAPRQHDALHISASSWGNAKRATSAVLRKWRHRFCVLTHTFDQFLLMISFTQYKFKKGNVNVPWPLIQALGSPLCLCHTRNSWSHIATWIGS